MTKIQSIARRMRQRIGTMMAKRAVIMDPTSSAEETKTLPAPAVKTDDFVRSVTVTPCTMAATPPPAIMANVHLRNGEISITTEAVTTIPAMIAAGDEIRSKT
jgi:hypothetical protein